jgi:hypothetical protein
VDNGGRLPVVELLDWVGDEVPARETLSKLNAKLPTTSDARITPRVILARWSKTDYPTERLAVVARSVPVGPEHRGGIGVDWWTRVDERLRNGVNLD